MSDLISVVVPIYRVEKYLDQCVQSILNQTYKNLEIILVDDGSDDKCPQICDYYASIDSRVKVVHQNNAGPDAARKAGLSVSSGKYIGYVDGDDWIEPEMYERLYSYIKTYEVDVVESGIIDSWGSFEKKRVPYIEEGCYKDDLFTKEVEPRLLYAGVFFRHGISVYIFTKLYLKSKITKYQMMQGITNKIQDDTMVSLPCIAASRSLYVSHDCLYHYRARVDSLKRTVRADEVPNFIQCYPEFYTRFDGSKLSAPNDKQILYYTMFWLLEKAAYVFDDLNTGKYLTPFGQIRIQDKIVLYGAGATGFHMENYIRNVQGSNIVAWADQNYKYLQSVLDVCAPREIAKFDFDYVIITILRENTVQSARADLVAMGIPEEKILWIEQKYIDNPELLLLKARYQGNILFDGLL